VLDRARAPVVGLTKNDFSVFVGKQEQTVESVSYDPTVPVTIGLLVDVSHSQADSHNALNRQKVSNLFEGLLRNGDKAFVAEFSLRPSLLVDLTSDPPTIARALDQALGSSAQSGGTALNDSVYLACHEKLQGIPGRKALIVMSDMLDNQSNHTYAEAARMAQSSGVPIYPIVLRESIPMGRKLAESYAEQTGGVSYHVPTYAALKEVLSIIRSYLANIYVVRYASSNPHHHGSIRVKCGQKGVRVIAPSEFLETTGR
jgi:VWFA-related protein